MGSYYWSILNFFEQDIRHRARRLARLGLLPTFFGQSVSGVFKQKYTGDVTMTPAFTSIESIGLKVLYSTIAETPSIATTSLPTSSNDSRALSRPTSAFARRS